MRHIDEQPLTPEEEENLASCGAVGFSWKQVAAVFDFDPDEVRKQFMSQSGTIFDTYNRGRVQHELNIRLAVLKSAENGSSPAQAQMQQYYDAVDNEIYELTTNPLP